MRLAGIEQQRVGMRRRGDRVRHGLLARDVNHLHQLDPGQRRAQPRVDVIRDPIDQLQVLVRQRRACAMIASAAVSLVRRNVATGGGTRAAIAAISASSIGPGPLGMVPTSPSASAPCAIASRASSSDWMQQILIRVRRISICCGFRR